MAPRSTLRICAALSTTQLLPLIHILRNQPHDGYRDVLLWYSYENARDNRRMMMEVLQAYDFDAAYELSGLKVCAPRKSGPLLWPLQSLLRNRLDAGRSRSLLKGHLAESQDVEVWTD